MSAFNPLKQKLTVAEENLLIEFALGCSDQGLPVTNSQLANYVNSLLEAQRGKDYAPVGKNWTDCFIKQHHNKLQMHWSHGRPR